MQHFDTQEEAQKHSQRLSRNLLEWSETTNLLLTVRTFSVRTDAISGPARLSVVPQTLPGIMMLINTKPSEETRRVQKGPGMGSCDCLTLDCIHNLMQSCVLFDPIWQFEKPFMDLASSLVMFLSCKIHSSLFPGLLVSVGTKKWIVKSEQSGT